MGSPEAEEQTRNQEKPFHQPECLSEHCRIETLSVVQVVPQQAGLTDHFGVELHAPLLARTDWQAYLFGAFEFQGHPWIALRAHVPLF